MKTSTEQTQENFPMTGVNNNGEQPASATKTQFKLEFVDSGTTRHVEIIKIVKSHESKIIVRMKHMNNFIEKIESLLPHAKAFGPKTKNSKDSGDSLEVYREEFITENGIKYNFDLFNDGKDSFLGIKCIKNSKKDMILISSDVLQSFLDGCKNFAQNYPEIDFRDARAETKYGYSRERSNYRRNGPNTRNGFSNMSQQTERSQPRKPLKVVFDVISRRLESGEKAFVFEVVKGENKFIRITEFIRDSIKEAVHIPLNDAVIFAKVIEEMISEHALLSKKTDVE